MRCKLAGALSLAMFAALAGVNLVSIALDPDSVRPMRSGDPAPTFALPRIGPDGEVGPGMLELEALRGQVVVLDFWASWCDPCRASMPMLEKTHREMADRGVTFVSVNTEGRGKAKLARSMASSLCPSLPLVSDDGRVSDMYKVDMIPHMVVIDRQGRVRQVHRGLPRGGVNALHEELSDILDKLLSER